MKNEIDFPYMAAQDTIRLIFSDSDEFEKRVIAEMESAYGKEWFTQKGIIHVDEDNKKTTCRMLLDAKDTYLSAAVALKGKGQMPWWLCMMKAVQLKDLSQKDKEFADKLLVEGIRRILLQNTTLTYEPEILKLIADAFDLICTGQQINFNKLDEKVNVYKNSWESGFLHEQTEKGCAQCTLLAYRDVFGIFDKTLFRAASALSAGMALCGDGSCGGYSAGILGIGMLIGRSVEDLETKNKVAQYKGFELSQRLHEEFIDCYGSVVCGDIHKSIFGQSYILARPEEKAAFEEAGAHTVRCTTVIGMSMYLLSKTMDHLIVSVI